MVSKKYILVITISLFLCACMPTRHVSPGQKWLYADLRSISTPEDILPYYDLIAVYTRNADTDFQIRLDFLDLDLTPRTDLYLALDTQPGGTDWLPLGIKAQVNWEILLVFPAEGPPQVLKAPNKSPNSPQDLEVYPDLVPRIVRDPYMDSVVISMNSASLAPRAPIYTLQAFVAPQGEKMMVDSSEAIRSDSLPAPQTPVILAFWNTFPAFTPAQALRRWDGAHTGPFGERHGLQLLLSAVQQSRVPIVLLDLKSPTSLSALDYLGVLPKIKMLVDDKLLVLPDAIPETMIQSSINSLQSTTNNLAKVEPSANLISPSETFLLDWAVRRALADERQISLRFGLQGSQLLYAPYPAAQPPGGYPVIFTPIAIRQPIRWKDRILIPIPSIAPQYEPGIDGPSVDLRREMLENATSDQRTKPSLIILGGSLPDSSWGDPESSKMTLRYVANHPWIKPLNIDDILSMRNMAEFMDFSSQVIPSQPSLQIEIISSCTSIIDQLNPSCSFPSNAITQSAWQAYQATFVSLSQNPPITPLIRSSFMGQIKEILTAGNWAADPTPQITCEVDPDQDGQPECILASKQIFSLIELEGARLAFLFGLSPTGPHQFVGPSTQFYIDTNSLPTTDIPPVETSNLNGTIMDYSSTENLYTPHPEASGISFTSKDGSNTKTFRLTDLGIQISYHAASRVISQITLAIDPWRRFYPNWGNQFIYKKIDQGWSWGYQDGPTMEITSTTGLKFTPFTASHSWMILPENPNIDYPTGHFIPFPLALLEIHANGDSQVQINLFP